MSATNTAPATTTNDATANGKPEGKPEAKSVSAILKEVQNEGGAKDKANPGKKDAKPKKEKAAKPKKADAAAPATAPTEPAAPSKDAPTRDPLALVTWLPAPAPVPLKELTEERRLQHRKDMQDDGEGGAVEQYAEGYKAGKTLPRLRYVLDISDTPAKGTKWLVDGYQRKGALKKAKKTEAECEYVEGNFADALILSLAANAENSVLARNKDDKRRSVFAILDNKDVLAALLDRAKGNGGAIEVFAKVCGCSTGTVANALADRGKKAKIDTLVDVPVAKKDKKPKATTATNPATPPANLTAPATPEEQAKIDAEGFERLKQREVADLFAEMKKSVKGIAARIGALLVNQKYGQGVKEELEANGFPVDPEFFRRMSIDGTKFAPHYEMLELWPFVETAMGMVEGVERTVQAMQEAEADAGKIPGTTDADAAKEEKEKATRESAQPKA